MWPLGSTLQVSALGIASGIALLYTMLLVAAASELVVHTLLSIALGV